MTDQTKTREPSPAFQALWDAMGEAQDALQISINRGDGAAERRPLAQAYLAACRAVRAHVASLEETQSAPQPAPAEAAGADVLERVRAAMRAIGGDYHLVSAAASRAAKNGRHDTAERLEYVYGRLYFIDHALGTMRERVERADSLTGAARTPAAPASEAAGAPAEQAVPEHIRAALRFLYEARMSDNWAWHDVRTWLWPVGPEAAGAGRGEVGNG
jgi:hypothetical protein